MGVAEAKSSTRSGRRLPKETDKRTASRIRREAKREVHNHRQVKVERKGARSRVKVAKSDLNYLEILHRKRPLNIG